jgi:iron-sulfur cluster repair protein YtfE (RIC family)
MLSARVRVDMGLEPGAMTHPRTETASRYLEDDHARLLSLLERAEQALAADPAIAGEALRGFASGLARHMRLEEEVVFPLFEVRTGLVGGPTDLMRQEHVELETTVEALQAALARGSCAAFGEAAALFRRRFSSHVSKEEHFVYPAVEQGLSDAERRALVSRLSRDEGAKPVRAQG